MNEYFIDQEKRKAAKDFGTIDDYGPCAEFGPAMLCNKGTV